MGRFAPNAHDDAVASYELEYDLDATPPPSLYSFNDAKHPATDAEKQITQPSVRPADEPLPASISLLFSSLSLRQRLCYLVPAISASIVAGAIAPFMTLLVGQTFAALAQFPTTPNPPQEAKDKLLHDVGVSVLGLLGLAVASLVMSSLTSCLWVLTGENNVMALRKRVYASISRKDMAWFDATLGSDQSAEGDSAPQGAGGFMAKFTREAEEVRMGSSLASGMLVQNLTTCIAALVIAFFYSWSLTLVILSAVPILALVQTIAQISLAPIIGASRTETAVTGTLVERAVNAIATIKAFNAQAHEQKQFDAAIARMTTFDIKSNIGWGISGSTSQFVSMSMFVQGFWFGTKLVRDGTLQPGAVMSVFWACLIASSNMQMCFPQCITLNQGKWAASALLSPIETQDAKQMSPITPGDACDGELSMQTVTFAYPSRPTMPVLRDVSIFLPAGDLTFIVGGSGSGKSTISHLLMRMYEPLSGDITISNQVASRASLDWIRAHVASVAQSCILFDMSVHDNVAMGLAGSPSGRAPADVSREEVITACTAALMNDFIRDLPDGYDTKLGNGGANLSGGQRQRLAIARAYLRNPTVLILDEATSALDPTSRVLVFEAIKRWRAHKTTIVITHDLSQITKDDFVYVMKNGELVEQGFREDLETIDGEFSELNQVQKTFGGFLPTKDIDVTLEKPQVVLEDDYAPETDRHTKRFTMIQDRASVGPQVLSNWMFDAVTDLTVKPPAIPRVEESRELSDLATRRPRRPSSIQILPVIAPAPAARVSVHHRRSLQFTPTSPTSFSFHSTSSNRPLLNSMKNDEELRELADNSDVRRSKHERLDVKSRAPRMEVIVEKKAPSEDEKVVAPEMPVMALFKELYPTIPRRTFIAFGLVLCVLSGVVTPVFSYLLSFLFFEVSRGAPDASIVNFYGGLVLMLAALDGVFYGLKYFVMDTAAVFWMGKIRREMFRTILGQDKKWFDKTENSTATIIQVMTKDGEDAREILATALPQCIVAVVMVVVGLTWAMVTGWQFTLAGLAIGPIFAMTMAVQTRLMTKTQTNNRNAREKVSTAYYEMLSNIRGIRAMKLDTIFERKYDEAVDHALKVGMRGSFVEGCSFGVASGLIYASEALLFYIGAVLIAKGTYTYLQMLQALNLVVFSVTIAAQLMTFAEKLHRGVIGARHMNRILQLPVNTDESYGSLEPPIRGDVHFSKVNFAYPERPNVPILDNMDLTIRQGESVAIVGTSGSGKSTVVSLLQRLYEPKSGRITIGHHDVRRTDVHYLRQHVSVVNQHPHLFDASIADNISYGDQTVSFMDVRKATKSAMAHDFVMSLPKGYETHVGESATLISGGQAQRLQIARALVRPSNILVLDECTSALDPANQAAVLQAVQAAKEEGDKTVIMVTHKLAVMKTCERIVVMDHGRVAEQGTFKELMESKGGIFASLASGGEWSGE